MSAQAAPAHVGARGFDCVTVIDKTRADALKAWGMDFAVRYLGSLSEAETDTILASGLALMPVTYGLRHGTIPSAALGTSFGNASVKNAQAAGIPVGVSVWLDLEDSAGTSDQVVAFVTAWCAPMIAAGYMPCLYVGAGAILTGPELYALPVVRYWQSLSKEVDRRGQIAEPNCGWCMVQLYPSTTIGGTFVDVDVVQSDYRGRLPAWAVAVM